MAKRDLWFQIRMSGEELARIDRIVASRQLDNRADWVRAALREDEARYPPSPAKAARRKKSEKVAE